MTFDEEMRINAMRQANAMGQAQANAFRGLVGLGSQPFFGQYFNPQQGPAPKKPIDDKPTKLLLLEDL